MDRNHSGAIAISADIYDADKKLIARLKNNQFVVNPNKVSSMPLRPDQSTLIILDEQGREVLKARYLNAHAFKITGILTIPETGNVVNLDHLPFDNICLGSNGMTDEGMLIDF